MLFADMPELIREKEKELLRNESRLAAVAGSLTPVQLDLIYRHKWFHLFVPKTHGGLELSLPEALQVEETLAAIDGSLGWTVTLCAGAAWFAGFLDQALAGAIFSDPKVCVGGSGASTGAAVKTSSGFRISGQWRFATGAPHLTHFTANCQLQDERGNVVLDPDGSPAIKAFIFKREEVEIIPDWRGMGLTATASHSFRLKDVAVPPERAFAIDSTKAQLPQPIFRYPFLPFAAATLAVNYCGMATYFLELAADIFQPKRSEQLTRLHQEAVTEIALARQALYDTVETSWQIVSGGEVLSDQAEAAVNQAGGLLADLCIRKVDLLFPYCGMSGADLATDINRVWRDLHTASQHGLLRALL